MRMHRRNKEGCSSASFKQERYQVCKNVFSIAVAGGTCVWSCRYAVSLSDRSPCFASLYASLCLSSFTGRLAIHPPGTLRETEGQTLQITCRYYGNGGAGNWSWVGPAVWRGRAIITHDHRRRESILSLNPLHAKDSGTYVCLCGSQAATVEIIVHSELCVVCVNVHVISRKGQGLGYCKIHFQTCPKKTLLGSEKARIFDEVL